MESALSTRDLRDLFSLKQGTLSDTHDKRVVFSHTFTSDIRFILSVLSEGGYIMVSKS